MAPRQTPTNNPLTTLQGALGHQFAEPALLLRALTHRSFSADHYERLEFLGDAVLGMAVAHMLYEAQGELAEGELSRVRAKLVRQDSLHQLALGLGLPALLRLGEGEARSGGRQRPSILADVLEAIIGAVYLDGGHDAAVQLVRRLFADIAITPALSAAAKDAKTSLQEWLQARRMALPRYDIVRTIGAAHRQMFEVSCAVPERQICITAQGRSRRAAEQEAAAAVLQQLQSAP